VFVSKSKWREINRYQKGGNNFGKPVACEAVAKRSLSVFLDEGLEGFLV
jgi:hypothetical protein